MSLDDLRDAGVLLPEEEWGERPLETTMSRSGTIACGVVAVGAGAAMYLGGGGAATLIGAGIFLLDLFAFTWLSLRAVEDQTRRHPPAAPSASATH